MRDLIITHRNPLTPLAWRRRRFAWGAGRAHNPDFRTVEKAKPKLFTAGPAS